MSNFTKALKELTGFGDEEQRDSGSVLTKTDEALKAADDSVETMFEESPVIKTLQSQPIKSSTIPVDTINASEKSTFISSAMMIQGDIQSDEDILLEGYIAGDVVTTRSFRSKGVQVGNVDANRLAFESAKHKGNILVKELAAIGTDSIVVGDIKSNSIRIDGKIKGNLDIETETLLLDNACIIGSVATGKINPAPSARINGSIILREAMNEIDDVFDFDIDFNFGGEN